MSVAALISATREAREPGVALRATFWLAGRTLVERQARLAAGAGATLIVILIETLPADLVQAVERLRAEGLEVITARTAGEASAAVPPGYRLILVADGFVGSRAHIERLQDAHRPALLAVTDRGFDDRFERIDGDLRWAGLAFVDGDLLREAAMLPSDWDLISTLIRRALQTGVRPLTITDEREAAEIAIVERRQDFAELQRRILASATAAPANWFSRWLLAPAERAITLAIMTSSVTPTLIGALAVLLGGLGLAALLFDWRWVGVIILVLALPLEGVAVRLARLRLQRLPLTTWWRLLLPVLAGAALVALGYSVIADHGWGMLVLACMTVIFALALPHERGDRSIPGARWLADPASLTFLLLPVALAGGWVAGIAILFAYGTASFFWTQYQVHRRPD